MRVITASFNLVGGLAGLLAIALVIWRGGALERQVEIDTVRITRIEDGGSSTLRQHIVSDDERVSDLARRVGQSEEMARQSVELKVEVRVLGNKLDNIAKQLEDIKQTAVSKLKP